METGYEERKKERVEHYNKRLKAVKNEQDFKDLMKKVADDGYGGCLYGKRRGYYAFGFQAYPHNPAKCYYLYDDGISTGLCRWENLYWVLKFRI